MCISASIIFAVQSRPNAAILSRRCGLHQQLEPLVNLHSNMQWRHANPYTYHYHTSFRGWNTVPGNQGNRNLQYSALQYDPHACAFLLREAQRSPSVPNEARIVHASSFCCGQSPSPPFRVWKQTPCQTVKRKKHGSTADDTQGF